MKEEKIMYRSTGSTGSTTLSTLSRLALLVGAVALTAVSGFAPPPAFAQTVAGISSPVPRDAATQAANNAATLAYWTEKRMQAAKPYPEPALFADPAKLLPAAATVPAGAPGGRTGYNPEDPESSPVSIAFTLDPSVDLARARAAATPAEAGVTPASASYPSAQTTFQYQGTYRQYPASTIGRVFFTQNGSGFACSGSLIGYKYVVTAGHCVHSGNNSPTGWSSNFMFCPDYDSSQGGVNPALGCWVANTLVTSGAWYSSSNEADADIGMAVFTNSGSLIQNYPGNVQGWLGYAWNWGIGQHDMMFGYPAEDRQATANNSFAHFQGGKIFTTAAEEAGYTITWGSYAPSKFLGTTQTPGMSGGPWVLFWGMKYYLTFASNAVNGVNSHLRCYDQACTDLYQEISSPQFIRSGNGNGVCSGTCGAVDTIDWTFQNFP
jgi:hypothetical protein